MNITEHKLYPTWSAMIQRCHNTKAPNYTNYGGRGITVCGEWHNSRTFLEWVDNNLGERPEGHTLDRIDNNKGYEPGNIRWADRGAQTKNSRKRRPYQYDRHNSTGFKYVKRLRERYVGQFKMKGVYYNCGTYDTPEEAHAAALARRASLLG